MGKRGVSAVIATILLILITIAAVMILWMFILPTIKNTFVETVIVDMEILDEGYTRWDSEHRFVHVQVKRGVDDAKIIGYDLIFVFEETSVTHFVDEVLELNTKKVHYINLSGTFGELELIRLVPVFEGGIRGSVVSELRIRDSHKKDLSGSGKDYEDIDDDCTPRADYSCDEGDVYWYDSCGERGEIKEECINGSICIGRECVGSGTVCGDDICNGTENCSTCPGDCGDCPAITTVCGDSVCNGTENCSTCPGDCGDCPTYYVATDGNDANPGTIDEPFRTIQKARDTIRATGSDGITVYIREGAYLLNQTLAFDSQDSGSLGSPNVYMAYPGENVYIKGSKKVPVDEFSPYSGNILQADLSAYGLDNFAQLFLNGKRLIPARHPNFDPDDPVGGGFLYVASAISDTTFKYNPGDVDPSDWTNIQDGQVNIFGGYNYWNNIINIASIDAISRTVQLKSAVSFGIGANNRYYFQHIFEELNSPNEWYWNRYTDTLYLYPPDNLEPDDIVSVPVVNNVISVSGAQYLEFRGLTVEECKSNSFNIFNSDYIAIDNCTVRNSKEVGVSVYDGSNVTVNNCQIYETGSWAIHGINSVSYFKQLRSCNYLFSNNTIHDTGVFRKGSYGGSIYIDTFGTTISYNHIYNVPRIGIRFDGNENVIEYNHIHDVNHETEDSGAIYQGGRTWLNRGNVIRYNYLHDTGGYGYSWSGEWTSPYYTWAIYLDDFSSGTHIYGNTIKNSYWGGIFVHSGRDNILEDNTIVDSLVDEQMIFTAWNNTNIYYGTMWDKLQVVRNNQDGWNGDEYFSRYPELNTIPAGPNPPQDEIMSGNAIRGNIIVYPNYNTHLYLFVWLDYSTSDIDNNIVWSGGKSKTVFIDLSEQHNWDWLKGLGFDNNSTDIDELYLSSPYTLTGNYIFLVNTNKEDQEFSLGGLTYGDLNGNLVSGSVTLGPFESKVLLDIII